MATTIQAQLYNTRSVYIRKMRTGESASRACAEIASAVTARPARLLRAPLAGSARGSWRQAKHHRPAFARAAAVGARAGADVPALAAVSGTTSATRQMHCHLATGTETATSDGDGNNAIGRGHSRINGMQGLGVEVKLCHVS